MNCIRNKKTEEEIIFLFFAKNRKKRANFLMQNDKRINDMFDYLQDKFLDAGKLKQILSDDIWEKDIFYQISTECNCTMPYIFSYDLKGYIPLKVLCELDMMMFQEVIVYFGKGRGYFQAHEKGGSRERYFLESV